MLVGNVSLTLFQLDTISGRTSNTSQHHLLILAADMMRASTRSVTSLINEIAELGDVYDGAKISYQSETAAIGPALS